MSIMRLSFAKGMSIGRWKLESIITHEFGIDDLEKAIKTSGNADKAGNVVIRF